MFLSDPTFRHAKRTVASRRSPSHHLTRTVSEQHACLPFSHPSGSRRTLSGRPILRLQDQKNIRTVRRSRLSRSQPPAQNHDVSTHADRQLHEDSPHGRKTAPWLIVKIRSGDLPIRLLVQAGFGTGSAAASLFIVIRRPFLDQMLPDVS